MDEIILETNKKNYVERITCSKENKKLLMIDCAELLLKERPDLKDIKITHNFILGRVIKYFLK